jgi:carbamate kinase
MISTPFLKRGKHTKLIDEGDINLDTKKKVVIALGGNALGNSHEEQQIAVANTAKAIVDLVEQDVQVILTHGNGTQVGMIQTAMDELRSHHDIYGQTPLPSSVAMSQGYIGIDLQNAIKYELEYRNIDMKVSTILSQIEVDADDEAFKNLRKPIGKFLTKEEADKYERNGIKCMEDAGRGYRMVVASPMPKRIRELETIKTLVNAGHIVITCGGGGIPVIKKDGKLVGANAVIDKDNASSLLDTDLDADFLVILTAVEKVAINFGKENQEWLSDINCEQAKKYIAQGQFAPGSMLPKVEAAVRFAESGENKNALITLLEKASDGIAGKTGTVIHK